MSQPKIGLSLNYNGWGIVTERRTATGEKSLFALDGIWRAEESIAKGTELRQVWLEHRLPRKAMVTFPALDILWSTLEIPPVPESDIHTAVLATWDVLQRNERYILAYQIVEHTETIRLRVGAVDSAEIASWLEILESAGIEPVGFILQSQAIASTLMQEIQPAVFVITSDNMIEMGIAESGIPVQLRTFPWNSQDLEEIKEAILLTLHAWTMKNDESPEKMVLLGSNSINAIKELIWNDLNLHISTGEDCFNGGLSLIAAFGAYKNGNDHLGVIWHPRIASIEKREKITTLLLAVAALTFFVVGSFFFYWGRIKKSEEESVWIKQNLSLYHNLNAIVSEDEHIMAKLSKHKNQWEQRNVYTYYLDRWQETVPPGTVLSSWTLEGMRVLEISGRTPSAAALLDRLAKDEIFSGLAVSGPVFRNPKGWDEFRLTGQLIKEVGEHRENNTRK